MTGFFEEGDLVDGGTWQAPRTCSVKVACLTGTVTVSETINGEYSANPTTIDAGQHLVIESLFQLQSLKVTGGTASYQAYAKE